MVLSGRSVYYLLTSARVNHGGEIYPVGCGVAESLGQRIGACGLWGLSDRVLHPHLYYLTARLGGF